MKTCDKCANYRLSKYGDVTQHEGECALMGDVNQAPNQADRCVGWDVEGYGAGVFVGPKFGCIHWIEKGE